MAWPGRRIFAEIRTEIRVAIYVGAAFVLALCSPVIAQDPVPSQQRYQMPPKAIADLVDAPRTPFVSVSPDREWTLLIRRPGLPSIEEVSEPELRLAGLRINPRTNGPSRGWYFNALTFKRISDGLERDISGLPDTPRISDTAWSPDGKWIAFIVTRGDGLYLWAASLKDGQAKQILSIPLNGAYSDPFKWLSDSRTLIALAIPSGRGSPPAEPSVPVGPIIQENLGRKAPARTYQDMLKNAHDEAMFEYYATAQVLRVALKSRSTAIGPAGIISRAAPAPNGKYILVETIHRPFSYSIPMYRFPNRVAVWDLDGNVVCQVADLPLADQVPITFGSVPMGRREFAWRADADATLSWSEALDGGDGGAEAELRDQVYLHAAPFDSDPVPLITLELRFSGVVWGGDDLAFVTEWWWKTRRMRAWRVKPGDPHAEPQLVMDRSWEDRYSDPGMPLMQRTDRGTQVILTAGKGNTIFLSGDGASPEGDRPFLDELDLESLETKRLFRSEAPYFERPVRMLDVDKRLLLTRREAVSEPPNHFLRDLRKGGIQQKTFFPHPTPQLAEVQKELIRYERADGVQLTATLYLPAGYSLNDGSLPTLVWAYPQAYKSADAAGQVQDSPYRFVRVAWYSPLLWLVHGYAVLDGPTMPIVGEGDEEPNDAFVEQLVTSAQAAVDAVVTRGVADRERIAIGGHSYGAFMVANILAHTDLFRLGLARSGAYNRTLTPFGFQSEERTLWEAPDVYFDMSPFMHADKINEPILLIHGEADPRR